MGYFNSPHRTELMGALIENGTIFHFHDNFIALVYMYSMTMCVNFNVEYRQSLLQLAYVL